MTYDAKCADLARAFLADSEKDTDAVLVDELAQRIQGSIEDFLEEKQLQA